MRALSEMDAAIAGIPANARVRCGVQTIRTRTELDRIASHWEAAGGG